VWKTIIEFEICGILPEIRGLKLKRIMFVEELEVPLSTIRDPGVIGIERQLSAQHFGDAEHTGQQE
jgi:hypothetical protein